MMDLSKRVENDVKQAIQQHCAKVGIDKSEVMYCIGGGGVVAPQVAQNPATGESTVVGFAPTWTIAIGLRSKLVGQDPVVISAPIFNVLPTTAEINLIVAHLLPEVNNLREQRFNGAVN